MERAEETKGRKNRPKIEKVKEKKVNEKVSTFPELSRRDGVIIDVQATVSVERSKDE